MDKQIEELFKKMRLIKQHINSFDKFVLRLVQKTNMIKADKDLSPAEKNRKLMFEINTFSNNVNYQIEKIKDHILLNEKDIEFFENEKNRIKDLKKEYSEKYVGDIVPANKIKEDILDG